MDGQSSWIVPALDCYSGGALALYEINRTTIVALHQTTFSALDFNERFDLQRLLKQHIEVIAPDILLIAEEFCDWDESKRRIDLLGVDRDANLVAIELKRTEDGGHMDLQAIRYAAMISAMSFSKAVEVYGRYLEENHSTGDAENALLRFLNWDVANEDTFGQDVRVVLVSAEFSKEVTTSVLWLNEHALDIRCVRLRPYALDDRVILDVQQIIPLPEADSYTVQLKKKAEENRQARAFLI
jgi:RecB family endonuclease NucS